MPLHAIDVLFAAAHPAYTILGLSAGRIHSAGLLPFNTDCVFVLSRR
jgi:hypothetical protein